jgi:phosphoribosyl 1,2-cyclic phosphodiesterase
VTEEYIYIVVPDDAPPEARKELEDLEHQTLEDIHQVIGIPFMLHKGLKCIPTILAWAFEKGGSYGDDYLDPEGKVSRWHLRLMKEVYDELSRKVDVKIEEHAEGRLGAVWPCEVLDLKEVQEEAMLLAKSDKILVKMDNKRDYQMLLRRAAAHTSSS